jgi:hypothetical protein
MMSFNLAFAAVLTSLPCLHAGPIAYSITVVPIPQRTQDFSSQPSGLKLNDAGQVLASQVNATGPLEAYLWTPGGAAVDLGALFSYYGADLSSASGGNSAYAAVTAPGVSNLYHGGAVTPQPGGFARAVNDFGVAVGDTGNGTDPGFAAIWVGGVRQIPFFTPCSFSDVNNAGIAICSDDAQQGGYYDINTHTYHQPAALRYNIPLHINEDGVILVANHFTGLMSLYDTNAGVLTSTGLHNNGTFDGLNDSNAVTGLDNTSSLAFLLEGGTVYNLYDYVPIAQYGHFTPIDINDSGQILANTSIPGSGSAVLLLTPAVSTPEPSNTVLNMAVICFIISWRIHRRRPEAQSRVSQTCELRAAASPLQSTIRPGKLLSPTYSRPVPTASSRSTPV